jgi:hypothetical protein
VEVVATVQFDVPTWHVTGGTEENHGQRPWSNFNWAPLRRMSPVKSSCWFCAQCSSLSNQDIPAYLMHINWEPFLDPPKKCVRIFVTWSSCRKSWAVLSFGMWHHAGSQLVSEKPVVRIQESVLFCPAYSLPWRTLLWTSNSTIVGTVTVYGMDNQGFRDRVPAESRIFTSPYCPDQLCGPPSLIWFYSWGKRGGTWSWPLDPD